MTQVHPLVAFTNHSSDETWIEALPTATLVVASTSEILVANAAARALFSHLDPIGLGLGTLFTLSGAGGSSDLADGIRAGRPSKARLNLADDQVLDVRSAPVAGGDSLISLFDVSAYIRDAEAGGKDALTGLLNRGGFQTKLQDALASADRMQTPVSVLCIDLDRFKNVNDTLGHPVGDALLIKVADRLKSVTRKGDIVARMGGDEFAIVQTAGAQPVGAEALAARLVDLLSRTYVISGHMLNIGASIGVTLSSSDCADAGTLLKRADVALYRAKADGRGQFRFFETAMDALMQERRLMELDLRRALALRQFELAFQPQYKVESSELIGFEALLRWRSPSRGFVSPADFIPLAEEIGLITPIGEWVLRSACTEAAGWSRPLSVAVNLSPIQFQNPKLVETIVSALAASGLPPHRLELEITEGALLSDTDAVLAALNALRALGVKISMDDFGTGYSSLSYLQKFPFNKIKIDQSFVRRMGDDPESKAIVRAVAALGASLGMTTTAEGVETAEQLAQIRAEGCTDVQGYLTGRPMPAAEASALVGASLTNSIPGEAA